VAGIYVLWYLIYELWLLPAGWLDACLCKNIAQIGYHSLHLLGYEAFLNGRHVGVIGTTGIFLVNGCSGITAIGLFIGFVVAYPGRWAPRMLFIIIGIGIIYLVNIIRIIGLTITLAEWPHLFHFMHTYSSTALFYIVIFGLWMIWANYDEKSFLLKSSPAATA
jgi:exosortase/archaeosortase family protein